MSSAKWEPFCLSPSMLTFYVLNCHGEKNFEMVQVIEIHFNTLKASNTPIGDQPVHWWP